MSDISPSAHQSSFLFSGFDHIGRTDDLETLREQLYRFYIAVEQSPAATAITDTEGHIAFVNQRFLEVTGYSREELIGNTPSLIRSGMTPDDVYREMWQTLRDGNIWRGELLNRKKNGELYWESEIITPVKDDTGAIVNFVAVKEDITERKHQESRLKLMATAFETAQATIITDADMRIEQVNQAFTDITGYCGEEVVGKTPRIFKSGRHDNRFYRELWDNLLTNGHWQGEIWNRNKYGDIYPVLQSITAVYDDHAEIRHFVAVFHNISERKRIEQELEQLVTRDHLTGVGNRRAFDQAMEQNIARAERHDVVFSLLMFDIDHFKVVNDTHGHETGDAILKRLALLVEGYLRKTDILSRWGGEEFTILLPDTPAEGALELAERIRHRVEHSCFEGLRITISLGLTQYRRGDDAESMSMRADEALYRAKRVGRNRIMSSKAP